ncbi:aminomethyltransferase family protein [Qiania dongpingensis]|uniref:Aminomethyl transferase family protein n=1 Tax=Qiania dongpingensis TaxID=2763669 RepID=A0A7G9G7K0_9FIRM|nr:aminomethyltransferase family protein [Qiania dongpingensis]QNM06782.1 aminomethyl transferase family protein [Qiania dongpingensis]
MYQNVYKYDEMKRSEHMAVRQTAGWYYWTHQLLEVTGKDAAAFLDRMFANPVANLKVGRDRYTAMLNEKAEIIDDVVVLRLEEDKFWVSTLFVKKLTAWFDAHRNGEETAYEDVTKKWDMYAVQGPRSRDLVNALTDTPVDEQKFFSIADNSIEGIPVKINRGGFTGEKLGYEIYVSPEQGAAIEEKLREKGEAFDAKEVTDFQIMAISLPTEAGFYYMRDLMYTNPFEVGLERGIGWDRDFIGREALEKIREQGPAREMLGFTVEEADVHIQHKGFGGPGDPVLLGGREVGRVSKFTYSFVKDINIGYILAEKGTLKVGDHVSVHGFDGVITEKPFI